MRYLLKIPLILLPVVMFVLSGCGSSSNGSASAKDPFSTHSSGVTGGIFGNTSTADGYGVIMFTDKAGTALGDQSNMLEPWDMKGVDPDITPSVAVLQLLPFRVTDANGNPRVGVPITLSVYSITSLRPDDVTIDFLVPPITEPDQRTITSDSAGMGIFNVAVVLRTPPAGSFTTSSVVFKAKTNDPIPITAYVGGSFSLTAKLPVSVP